MPRFRLLVSFLLCGTVLPLFSCGQPGEVAAGADAPGSGSGSVPATTSARASPAELDPCALLEPGDRSTAGLTSSGTPKTIGRARACDYTEPGAYGVTITVDDTRGLDDLRVEQETAEPVRIGGHDALRVADHAADDGTCSVLLGSGDSLSVQVDVSNTSFSDTGQACRRADTVAELIEPRLP